MADEHLPKHVLSMRRVCDQCQSQWEKGSRKRSKRQASILESSPSVMRKATLVYFQKDDEKKVDVIADVSMISPLDFRRDYQLANRPCLLEDCPFLREHFSTARKVWLHEAGINRTWFLESLGDEILPVRHQPGSSEDVLDDEGRAVECQTRNMSIHEWFTLLDAKDPELAQFYLKDWHLQQWVQTKRPSESPLYTVPSHFEHDLLNRICQFTDGDFRFVYWGAAGSRTGLHSDVLNSFSWSYNIHGTKEWTFFVPDSDRTIKIVQTSGQCVFVPATWKHTVVNLEETLSINHNWITAGNLDLCGDCLRTEIKSIQVELDAWAVGDWLARESMLRGCVGLDMTAYALMVVLRMVELSQLEDNFDELEWHQLKGTLQQIVFCPDTCLAQRMEATLEDKCRSSTMLLTMKSLLSL